jgi:hypothetical protein
MTVEYEVLVYASAAISVEEAANTPKSDIRKQVREDVDTGELGEAKIRQVRRKDE